MTNVAVKWNRVCDNIGVERVSWAGDCAISRVVLCTHVYISAGNARLRFSSHVHSRDASKRVYEKHEGVCKQGRFVDITPQNNVYVWSIRSAQLATLFVPPIFPAMTQAKPPKPSSQPIFDHVYVPPSRHVGSCQGTRSVVGIH